MAYSVSVHEEHQLGVVCLSGKVDGTQLHRALEALYADAAWTPGYSSLWDARTITNLAVSPAEANRLVRRIEELATCIGEGRSAAVTSRTIDRALSLMLFLRSRGRRERKVFSSLDEALSWLMEQLSSEHTGTQATHRSGAEPEAQSI